ncbi:hypothetical protein BHE74_00040074 [Ensete ventricosum]|nr:hypothetical protein GW17_00001058 [Ensete ventricosum]RWW53438.1 hypothetical protein BHE74_00040074 [Ensete ventricosum]RZS06394.1 hypothetical protein BHM03_00037041 [Ensete ventricosum]
MDDPSLPTCLGDCCLRRQPLITCAAAVTDMRNQGEMQSASATADAAELSDHRPTDTSGGAEPPAEEIPPWEEQITVRGVVVGAMLGTFFCIVEHHFNLRVGLAPSINLAAGLLSYFFISLWTRTLSSLGFKVTPFTKQENTMVQTSIVTCYVLAFSGNQELKLNHCPLLFRLIPAMGTEVGSAVEILEPLLPPEKIPPWREQITVRGLLVSTLLGALFCIITHKLNLTVGVIPSLNVAAGLLGFFFIKSWTELASRIGLSAKPFTRQENTVIQTCVVACYGLAFSGNC